MTRPLAYLIPAFVLFLQGPLFAQDSAQAAVEKAPRRILFVMEKGGLFSYSDNEIIILKRSFLTALSEVDDAPVPIDYSLKTFPSSAEARNKATREAGADCWLVVKVSGRGSPTLNVVSYDLLYNIKTLDFSVSRHEGFSMLDVSEERWDDVIPTVVKKYPPLISRSYSRGPPAPVTLIIRAVPGTTITGLSPKPLLVGREGTTTVELPSPAPYTLYATAFGYVPTRMNFYLDGQGELSVEQPRSPWLRLDGVLQDGFFPSVSANFSIPSLPLFARLEFTSFRVGASVNSQYVFTGFPYSQLTLLLGLYLSPEENDLRWYFAAGPLLRLTWPAGGSFGVDPLIPLGVQIADGCDFPLAGKLRGFVEFTPSCYYSPNPSAFYNSFGNQGSFPYIIFPSGFALDLLEFRFGVRWAL
jgi:hypothetical protein